MMGHSGLRGRLQSERESYLLLGFAEQDLCGAGLLFQCRFECNGIRRSRGCRCGGTAYWLRGRCDASVRLAWLRPGRGAFRYERARMGVIFATPSSVAFSMAHSMWSKLEDGQQQMQWERGVGFEFFVEGEEDLCFETLTISARCRKPLATTS